MLNDLKSVVIIDYDGTVTDFHSIDRNIIRSIFKSKLVNFIDRFLWNINSKNVFSNKVWLFNLRLKIYSLISKKSYKMVIDYYKWLYLQNSVVDVDKILQRFKSIGYENVIFYSHNLFSKELPYKVYSVKSKRKFILNNIYNKYNIVYVVGDNLVDDILLGMSLTKKNRFTRTVYIGYSFIVNFLLRKSEVASFPTLDDFIYSLEKKE